MFFIFYIIVFLMQAYTSIGVANASPMNRTLPSHNPFRMVFSRLVPHVFQPLYVLHGQRLNIHSP